MNPELLPSPGVIHNPEKDYLKRFEHITSIKGKRCLCIGYSEKEIDELILKYCPGEIIVLTLWPDHQDAQISKYPLFYGDITHKTEFPDGEFDVVLTFSVLEHLSNIEGAMLEIRRILKNGGYLCVFFGPAWSSSYGHHIYAKPGDPLLDFSVWQMPSHIHLLCTQREISEYYTNHGYNNDQCQEVLHWFYETPIINRIMYEDYLHFFNKYFILTAYEAMYNIVDHNILILLRNKYTKYLDFVTYGGKYFLYRQ